MLCVYITDNAPSRPNKSPESVTDFSRDIDTDWELVNGWRPPRSYQKSKIKLSGNDILIGNRIITAQPPKCSDSAAVLNSFYEDDGYSAVRTSSSQTLTIA